MKNVIIIANEIEKSGKTTASQLVNAYYNNNGMEAAMVNTDYNAQDWLVNSLFWDLENSNDTSKIVNLLDENEGVIIDIFTEGLSSIQDYCEQNQFFELLEDLDSKCTVVVPTDGSEASIEQVLDLAETFSDSADYLIMEYLTKKSSENKSQYLKSQIYKDMRYFNAKETLLPSIPNIVDKHLKSSEDLLPVLIDTRDNISDVELKNEIESWVESCVDKLSVIDTLLNPTEERIYS